MIYESPLTYWPRFAAALGIVIGGAGGIAASVQTAEPLRFLGTAVFLAITLGAYVWHFHISNQE